MRNIGRIGARASIALLLATATGCVHAPDYREWIAGCATQAPSPAVSSEDRIYFVTSRLPDCRKDGPRLSGVRTDHIRYGEARASVAGDSVNLVSTNLFDEAAWRRRLGKAVDDAGGRALLYVHGFNVSFAQAVERSRRLRQRTGFSGPIILFTWPSHGRGDRYTWDEENALWTQPYYDGFVATLLQGRNVSDLVLVAHSMGSRILLRSLVELDRTLQPSERGKIKTVILASPDVDRQILTRDYMSVLAEGEREATIYVSRRDRALRLSWGVHGLARAGDSSCRFWDWLPWIDGGRCFIGDEIGDERRYPIPDGVDVVDTSRVEDSVLGHSDFVGSRLAAADVCHVLRSRDFPPNRVRIGTRPNVFRLVSGPIRCRGEGSPH